MASTPGRVSTLFSKASTAPFEGGFAARLCGDLTDQSAVAKSGCAAHTDEANVQHRARHTVVRTSWRIVHSPLQSLQSLRGPVRGVSAAANQCRILTARRHGNAASDALCLTLRAAAHPRPPFNDCPDSVTMARHLL